MTDPVILLGTQSNGETLPVQVDGFGRLVAEGLQGSEGPAGPEGPAGGTFPLPADPYEGALLGWLGGQLAWIGSSPIPIPGSVFGPITAWDSESNLVTVEGEIPSSIGTGVYVYQCDQDGTLFTQGWNTSQAWSDQCNGVTNADEAYSSWFDAEFSDSRMTAAEGETVTCAFSGALTNVTSIRAFTYYPSGDPDLGGNAFRVNGIPVTTRNRVQAGWTDLAVSESVVTSLGLFNGGFAAKEYVIVSGWEINGRTLVDSDKSLNMRVNNVMGQSLIGIPSATVDFTIGKYLVLPEQRVAPWVLYGNDPTSLIDHLRSS